MVKSHKHRSEGAAFSSTFVGRDATEHPERGTSWPALSIPLSASDREHAANIARFRIAMLSANVMWPSFLLLDWLMSVTVYPGTFALALAVRLAVVPLHLVLLWRLGKRPGPTASGLYVYDVLTSCASTAGLALLAVCFGGIAGPYSPGVFLILICRNAFVFRAWRPALLANALVVFAHFVTLLAAEWWRPQSVFTVGTVNSLALLALHAGSLSFGAILCTTASHTGWALRRRVFEARSLGAYRLLERMAVGGHGEVWKAYHAALKQTVAIKVLKNEIAEDDRALGRFQQEIDALCRLRHPNTIQIMDYGVTADGVCYYVMELLDGSNLAELVASQGPMSPAQVTYLLRQTARALAEAHAQGILHRDVKPENVLVTGDSFETRCAKLIDFGIAKRSSPSDEAPALTRTGMVIGTPAFMAPEVIRGQPASFRSDVYALGALGYFLLTAEGPPDAAAGSVSLSNTAAKLRECMVPEALAQVLLRCLCADPARRFKDAGMTAQALEALAIPAQWDDTGERTQSMPGSYAPVQTLTQPERKS